MKNLVIVVVIRKKNYNLFGAYTNQQNYVVIDLELNNKLINDIIQENSIV